MPHASSCTSHCVVSVELMLLRKKLKSRCSKLSNAHGLRTQKDSWDIDYQATLNALQAARQSGAAHFVLLSAICVQKPLLEFQRAKLKFEAALQVSFARPTYTGSFDHGLSQYAASGFMSRAC